MSPSNLLNFTLTMFIDKVKTRIRRPHHKVCYLFIVMLASSVFHGCAPRQSDNIYGLWNIDNQGGDEGALANNGFLNLRADKTFTFYQPYYFDYGHWSFDGKQIKLISERKRILYKQIWTLDVVDKDKDVLKVSYPFANEKPNMPEPYKDDARERIVYKVHKNIFLRRHELQFPASRDPFSIENSRWRMRPDHAEDCKELQARIIGNLNHLRLLFARYNDTAMETFSWQFSPHPFILGSNGVALQSRGNVSPTWTNIFYNAADEAQAHAMIATLFKEDIDVPLHYSKYTDMWYPIIRQMDSLCRVKDMCRDKQAN